MPIFLLDTNASVGDFDFEELRRLVDCKDGNLDSDVSPECELQRVPNEVDQNLGYSLDVNGDLRWDAFCAL